MGVSDFKFKTRIKVLWGDMDSAQHVNNLVYMKWCEAARIEYFEKSGIDTSFDGSAIGPILGWQEGKYIYPMTYPDVAIVGVRVGDVEEDRIFLESAVFSHRNERVAFIGRQSIIPYDYKNLKKAEIPKTWLAGIAEYENKR